MKLSPGQQQQLLMLRQSHLAKMKTIYEERQRLNLEVRLVMICLSLVYTIIMSP